jgi:Icc-related predicted phosphoesterase
MRVAVTSDWHGYLPPYVPPCDLLVVAGDVGVRHDGGFENFSVGAPTLLYSDLRRWIEEQECEVVCVAGNHDFATDVLRSLPWTYLEDEAAVVGDAVVWGTPWSNPFGQGWAFNMTEEEQAENLRLCPDDVNVIVSHGPPYGACDRTSPRWGEPKRVGSKALRDRMAELPDLELVACGHIHSGYGREGIVVGGSLVDEEYRVANIPIVVTV